MKRRTVILKRILPCIAALLVLANCKNLFQPQELPPAATAQTGEGTFSLKIGGIRAGRTILPATEQDDFAAYTLVFQADGQTEVSAERTNANLGQAITLNAGTWNLAVTAFLDSEKTKPAAQGTITGIAISAGGSTSGSLELKPLIEADATGTFKWNIDYPDDVTLASMTITPLDEATGTAAQTLYFVGGEPPLIDKDNTAAPLELNTGYYRVEFNLSKGAIETGRVEYLHIYKNLESRFEHTFTPGHFTVYSVVSGEDSGPGSLRYAIANAADNSTILVEVETINLESRLEIEDKNLTIRGNGVTLTRSAAWTETSDTSQLLRISNSSAAITVNISRVHFKDGRATTNGAAVYNPFGTVNLESCIFSGNQTSDSYFARGGAVFNEGNMNIKGCTFYNNSSANIGGAIYTSGGGRTLTLTGNLFLGNAAANQGPVVYNQSSTATSNGYNVVDTNQAGWTTATGAEDTFITAGTWQVSPVSFRLVSGSEADGVITTLPASYPTADFYGDAIAAVAAAGAVQAVSSGSGYILNLTINNSMWGGVSAIPTPDADGYVPAGAVTLTASPAEGYGLANWLVNGTAYRSTNSLSLAITGNTDVQAVFGKLVTVTDFTDGAGSEDTPGTLRYALTSTNYQDGDIIRFTGVTAENNTIELGSALPDVTKNVTIQGNGVTLTPSATAWTPGSDSQLLNINAYGKTVNISRVHFKNGRATNYGAAVYNYRGTVNLESCIFSGNQTSGGTAEGGAIYNTGTMSVKGCTFSNNSSAYRGGAIYGYSGTLTLTGNLFLGNTATNSYPVVYGATSNGYNVVDVPLGTGTTESGWAAGITGDTTVTNPQLITTLLSFKLLVDSEAADVIDTLPEGYPQTDFYGDAIADGAAAGAVQSTASGYYFLELSVNNSLWGSISSTPAPDADGLVPAGSVTFTASPAEGFVLKNWLVGGTTAEPTNPLSHTMDGHITVQAVFELDKILTNFTDGSETTPGTLRFVLANAQDGDIISFAGVTAGTTTIELGSRLEISKSVTIEGNGVTLTRSSTWTEIIPSSQLLNIYNSSSAITVTISRVHFKNGRATSNGGGAAVLNNGETVNMESCIFSGNQVISGDYNYGSGAIYNSGTMSVKGCTFYNNSTEYRGGAIFTTTTTSTLTLTGNLFYGNTAPANSGPVVYRNNGTVTSNGYNVVDVDLGTTGTQSGWTAGTGDKTFTELSISGEPFSTTTFAPVTGLNSVMPSPAMTDFPAADFNGETRTWPGAPGAVK